MELEPPRKKTIIFTIARMNPPTSGHMKLIQTMMEANLALSPEDLGHDKIYILLSHTKDNEKNPLTCSRKRQILESKGMVQHIKDTNPSLRDIAVNILCMDDLVPEECGKHPILKHMCNIRLMEQPSEMKLFIGEDRASSYGFIISSLAKYNPPILVEPVVLARPEGAMSATFMRGLVTSGNKEDFIQEAQNNGLTLSDADELFDELTYELKSVVMTPASKRRKNAIQGGRKRTYKQQRTLKQRTLKQKHTYKQQKKIYKHTKKRYVRK